MKKRSNNKNISVVESNNSNFEIPERLKEFNFVLIGGETGKEPIEKAWQKKIHRFDCPILKNHLLQGKNYGVQSNDSVITINENTYFLVVVDFDKKEFQDKVINQFPETFTTSSGSAKNCYHLWFACDNNKPFKIKDEKLETMADIIGAGNQIIAPGSKHKSGSIYSIIKDVPFAFISYAELEAILKPFDRSPKKKDKIIKQYSPKGFNIDVSQKIYNAVSMNDVLAELNVDTTKNPTNCPFHTSNGGKCFSFNFEVAHCFHCENAWNKFSLIREGKNLTDKKTFEWFAEKAGMVKELEKSRKEYLKTKNEDSETYNNSENIFTRRGQLETFWQQQPFYYDKSKIFWLWDKINTKWVLSDEVDFCNLIYDKLGINTINSKERIELVEGFKQVGRMHKPKETEKYWVQFKDKIYDVKTGKIFEATPEFFITNPIPWKVGGSEDTPTIDKLFHEWVSEENIKTLYEILAYNICLDKFMQRIISLCGGGSNGKGTYIKLNYKFIGQENCVASEIKSLSEDKFEPAVLYRKLLCVMGEVSSDDLKNTNQLKKLGGEDKISFQFKGKTPFTADNTATCICLTNSLPITPDRTLGFYRKWLIVDFPNQFNNINKNLIEQIPNVEFENLAKKSLRILNELYNSQSFTNEGDFEERAKKYEEHSNPVMRFIEERCEEIPGEMTALRDFTNYCCAYLKSRHLRVMTPRQIGKILREEGFSVGNRKIDDVSVVVILNLTIKTIRTIKESNQNLRKEANKKFNSFDSINSKKYKALVNLNVPINSAGDFQELEKDQIYELKDSEVAQILCTDNILEEVNE